MSMIFNFDINTVMHIITYDLQMVLLKESKYSHIDYIHSYQIESECVKNIFIVRNFYSCLPSLILCIHYSYQCQICGTIIAHLDVCGRGPGRGDLGHGATLALGAGPPQLLGDDLAWVVDGHGAGAGPHH